MNPVIVDTGVIVGFLDEKDAAHQQCVQFFAAYSGILILPETVYAEVCSMLRNDSDLEIDFVKSVAAGSFRIESFQSGDTQRIAELVTQYQDFPLGGVDASIIAISERLKIANIATIDYRHFRAVRPKHVKAFRLLSADC